MGDVLRLNELDRLGQARQALKAKIEQMKSKQRVEAALQSKVVRCTRISESQLQALRSKGFMVVMEYEGNYKI